MSDNMNVPYWLVRCHWCATNYDKRRRIMAPHRYHWLCWLKSLAAALTRGDTDETPDRQ